jgi:hypothetical protein
MGIKIKKTNILESANKYCKRPAEILKGEINELSTAYRLRITDECD